MADVSAANMIEELQDDIQTGDAIKARLVLEHLGSVDERSQKKLLYILSKADPDFAICQLLHLFTSSPELTEQLPIIHETLLSVLLSYPGKVLEYLDKEGPIEEKVPLIRVAGELRMEEASDTLHKLSTEIQNEEVIAVIIESLGFIGDPESVSTLADFLYSADRELIIAAVQAMRQVGTSIAMQRLAERMGTDNELDYMILGIFAEVQDSISLERLNETIMSHYVHMRTFAKAELVKIGAKAVPFLIENLKSSDTDFLIHTLNVLGDIGDESAVAAIRNLLGSEPASANVRFAAYEALALLPLRKGAYTLTAGLTDPEEHVCIAAARAIDRNFSDLLGAGLKNILQGPEDEAKHISRIIINSQSDNIFACLVDEDSFVKYGSEYMPKAHPDLRAHFSDFLKLLGKEDSPLNADSQEASVRSKVVAVDDSRMILNIYKATLHELGYEPVLFEFPASALEWLRKEKPLAVLTDLNMPKITGVQLTQNIREIYGPEILPILMVTTQNESNDNSAAFAAGVTSILSKPFTGKTLGAALDSALKE
jgi:CheY-like chemotaxis protein